jgi:hypothetical protein
VVGVGVVGVGVVVGVEVVVQGVVGVDNFVEVAGVGVVG